MDQTEDCTGYLYHHIMKVEQMMEYLVAKMNSNQEETKIGQE
jgi:hypothetical protein